MGGGLVTGERFQGSGQKAVPGRVRLPLLVQLKETWAGVDSGEKNRRDLGEKAALPVT